MMEKRNIGFRTCLLFLFIFMSNFFVDLAADPKIVTSGQWTYQSLIEKADLKRRYLFHIAFSNDGSAWIAASDGLHRYDGYTWRRFGNTNGLPSNFIRSVYVDRENRLWVGSDRGVGIYDGTNYHSLGSERGLAGPNIRKIFQDKGGTLWFCCDRWPDDSHPGGLTCYKDGVWKSYSPKDGLPGDHVMNIFQNSDGRLFVLTSKGVAAKENEQWILLNEPGLDTNFYSVSMVQFQSDTVFLQGGPRVFPLIRKEGVWKFEYSGGFGPLCVTRKGEVLNVHYDEPTQLLCIQRWMGDRFEVVSPKASFLNGWVETIAEAPDGSIWCIGPEVILRWEGESGDWTQFEGLPPPKVIDNQNRLWFADQKTTYHLTSRGFQEIAECRGAIAADNAGNVWNWETNSIVLWEPSGKSTFESSQTGLAEIRDRIEDGGGRTWFIGRNNDGKFAVSQYTPPGWKSVPVPNILQETVESFDGDPIAGIWLLAKKNAQKRQVLVRLTTETNVSYDVPSRITIYRDNLLHVDQRGVWIHGFSGLNRLNPQKSIIWTQVPDLLGQNVYLAKSDPTRTVFFLDGRSGGRGGYAIITDQQIVQYPFNVDWFCTKNKEGIFYLKHDAGILVIPRARPPATARRW